GVRIQAGSGHTFENLAALNSVESGIEILGATTGNAFTGVLKVGGNAVDCNVLSTDPASGLINLTCTDDGAAGSSTYTGQLSDAVLHPGVSGAGAALGPILVDDAAHPADVDGFIADNTVLPPEDR